VEDRISGLKDKTDIKEKNRRIFREDWRAVKRMCKKSVIPTQKTKPPNHGHQRRRRGISQRHRKYIQQNNSRKLPKSQKRCPSRYRKSLGH
jgi:hypothetical protein